MNYAQRELNPFDQPDLNLRFPKLKNEKNGPDFTLYFFVFFFQKHAFFLFLLKKMKKCVNEPNFFINVFKNNCFFKKKIFFLEKKIFDPNYGPSKFGELSFFRKIA